MTLVAYIRVSSVGQSLEVQRDKMVDIGVEPDHIFEEKRSGLTANRPALKDAMRFARKGDVFCISRIDRLARSANDLLNIANHLQDKGVELRVLDQSIDTSTPAGKALFQMLAVFAEFETTIRSERQMDGIAKAKATGTRFGRKVKATDDVTAAIREMRSDGLPIKTIMANTKLSKATVYRALAGEISESPEM